MAAPVWVLSVDLQTKTATFQTGLADAAKAARGSFNDIKGGAGQMGGAVDYSMGEARHSVMLLGEEFGVHLPRALTTFIAGLGPIGPALEAAFPFLAIAVGATLLLEHLAKMQEAGEKLTSDEMAFGTAANNAFNSLTDKLLQAQIKADDLSGNHLGALRHQLDLIDHQSLNELQHSFLELAKAVEPVMKDLEGHWYSFGEGSEGAKHALDDFRTHYEFLLSQGKGEEASGLLHGTVAQAQKTLAMMDQLKSSQSKDGQGGDYQKYEQASAYLEKMGVSSKVLGDYTQKTYDAQVNLVSALSDQVAAEQRIAEIKKLESQNAVTSTNKKDDKAAEEAARKAAEEQTRLEREFLQNFKRDQQDLINATQEGTAARLSALESAINETAALYGRDNATYKEYANEYLKTWTEMSTRTLEAISKDLDEQERLKADAGRESADNAEKMGQLAIAAEKQHAALLDSAHRVSLEQRISEEQKFATDEYNIKMKALQQEEADLDKFGKDYENKLKQKQDKEKQLTQQHENELTAIREKAEIETNNKLAASYQQFTSTISGELTKSIMGHQTWAKMVDNLGDQMISGMVRNALQYAMSNKFRQESDAKAAATAGYKLGLEIGGPAGAVLAPIFGAVAFAGAMAFEGGTDGVPGVGRGDVVPAMLTPGEGVVPNGVMDGLSKMARDGTLGGGQGTTVVHVRPTYHLQALDGDGIQTVLTKHTAVLQRHFESTLRKMNR